MPRKPYASIVNERVGELENSEWRRIRNYTPSTEDLGDEFEHVFTNMVRNDSSISRAFKACKRSIDDPFNWYDLLTVLCDLHFPAPKVPVKTKRTPQFLQELKQDRRIVQKSRRVGQSAQARLLAKEFPERYGKIKFKTLLRIIQEQDRNERTRKLK
jgi:hypothetical protein